LTPPEKTGSLETRTAGLPPAPGCYLFIRKTATLKATSQTAAIPARNVPMSASQEPRQQRGFFRLDDLRFIT